MSAGKRAAIVIVGLLGVLVLILAMTRLWPVLLLSMLQRSAQGRMHCWVKVVDQDGQGVKAYKCRVVEDHSSAWFSSAAKSVVRVYETDMNGTFEYASKGATSIVFFGYSWGSQWALNPGHLMQRHNVGVYLLEHERAIREKPMGYLGSKGNPYLIHVFSVGRPQKLLFWKTQVNLQEKTNYACIDLRSGRVWQSKTPEGDVAMADGQYTKEGPPQCSVRIVAGTNCSLYPVVDDWGLEPPEGGYVKELCRGKDWQDKRPGSFGPLAFYYRLGGESGQPMRFGRLAFDLHGPVDGATLLNYMNLAGERNLFYKGYTDLLDQKIIDFVSPPVQ